MRDFDVEYRTEASNILGTSSHLRKAFLCKIFLRDFDAEYRTEPWTLLLKRTLLDHVDARL